MKTLLVIFSLVFLISGETLDKEETYFYLNSIFLELLLLLGIAFVAIFTFKEKSMILAIRWTIFIFFIATLLGSSLSMKITFMNSIIFSLIAVMPAFLATFFFNKKFQ